jgi:hypothetical protein
LNLDAKPAFIAGTRQTPQSNGKSEGSTDAMGLIRRDLRWRKANNIHAEAALTNDIPLMEKNCADDRKHAGDGVGAQRGETKNGTKMMGAAHDEASQHAELQHPNPARGI